MSSHLSKDLIKSYKTRSVKIRTGDKVKVLRGQFKKLVGKIARVDVKKTKAYIEGVELTKRDGSKTFYPIHPSNLLVLELNLSDQKRKQKLEGLNKNVSQKKIKHA